MNEEIAWLPALLLLYKRICRDENSILVPVSQTRSQSVLHSKIRLQVCPINAEPMSRQ